MGPYKFTTQVASFDVGTQRKGLLDIMPSAKRRPWLYATANAA